VALTLVAEYHYPVTEGTNPGDATTVALDKDDATWAANVASGDLVLTFVGFRGSAGTVSVTTDGGQTWTEEFDTAPAASGTYALYRCIFNGTWNADPVFTTTGALDTPELWAVALRGFDAVSIWDVAPSASEDHDTAFDLADFSTNTDLAWAFVGAGCINGDTATVDNSFVAPSGSGNVYWRSGPTTIALCLARKEITSAGAVGATTFTLTASRDGVKWNGAVKPAAEVPTLPLRVTTAPLRW